MKNMKILILAGNGALVGASFYNDIIQTLHKTCNKIYDNEFPEIIVYNLPINLNYKGELDNTDFLEKKLLEFNLLNIDYLFVLCNSLSNIINTIIDNDKINYKFVNIIENTKYKINEKSILLCSNFTNHKKLYGNENIIYINDNEQIIVDEIIDNILKGNNVKTLFIKLLKMLDKHEINNIVLGCTELYFIKELFDSNKYNVFDSLTLYKDHLIYLINEEN